MNFAGLNTCDLSNGPGIRVSLFVSGCTVKCKDCFNKEAWSFSYGNPFTENTKTKILKALSDPFVEGFSLLGGDPFEPEHEEVLLDLLKTIKETYPNKNIWCWTGRTLEQVVMSPLMDYIDTLIDGPFVKALSQDKLEWRGSSNQRIITIKQN